MKNYEFFNKQFNTNQNAEEQAIDMTLSELAEEYGISDADIDKYKNKCKAQLKWLNEEK